MFTFTVCHDKSIYITTNEVYDPCAVIHKLEDLIPDSQKQELWPESYDFIINGEKYGCFFTMGSPQMLEDGWKVHVEYSGSTCNLKLTLPKQQED